MELEYTRTLGPRFCWQDWKKEMSLDGKQIYSTLEEIGEETKKYQNTTKILGKISEENARKWKDWKLGELYAVVHLQRLLFCTPEGYVFSISEE